MPATTPGSGSSAFGQRLPAAEPIDRSPRIAALTGAVNQDIWVLRELGFTADPVSTATINRLRPIRWRTTTSSSTRGPGPATTQPVARARLTAFFASRRRVYRRQPERRQLPRRRRTDQRSRRHVEQRRRRRVQRHRHLAQQRPRHGHDHRGVPRHRYGDHRPADVVHSVPGRWTTDGKFPLSGFFLSGLFPGFGSSGAADSPVIAHGLNTAGARG